MKINSYEVEIMRVTKTIDKFSDHVSAIFTFIDPVLLTTDSEEELESVNTMSFMITLKKEDWEKLFNNLKLKEDK